MVLLFPISVVFVFGEYRDANQRINLSMYLLNTIYCDLRFVSGS